MSIVGNEETPLETQWTTGNRFADENRRAARCKLRGALGHLSESVKSFTAFLDRSLVDWQDEGSTVEPFLFMLQQELLARYATLTSRAQFQFVPAESKELIADIEEALRNLDA